MFPSPHAQPLPHGCLGPLVLQHPPAAPSCGSAHFFIAHPHLHPQPLSVLLSPQLQAGPGDSPTSVLPRFCVKEAQKRVNWSAGGIAAGSAAGMSLGTTDVLSGTAPCAHTHGHGWEPPELIPAFATCPKPGGGWKYSVPFLIT